MRVLLESADPRLDAEDVFSVETEEIRVETIKGNPEYVTVADVNNLGTLYASSQQGRIVVEEPPQLHESRQIELKVTEYNDYIE